MLFLLGACFGRSDATIRYEVRLSDGGAVPIEISYTRPSGEIETVNGKTPWRSSLRTFRAGSTMSISSGTTTAVDGPLLCVLAGVGDAGEWTLRRVDEPLSSCDTSYQLGRWPPSDLSGPLIRVG